MRDDDDDIQEYISYREAFPKDYRLPKPWVGLTDEEYVHITDTVFHQGHGLVAYYLAIEAKLKEKNA